MGTSQLIVGEAPASHREVLKAVRQTGEKGIIALFIPPDEIDGIQDTEEQYQVLDFTEDENINAHALGSAGVKISGTLQYHYPGGPVSETRLGLLTLDPLLDGQGLRPTIKFINFIKSQFTGSDARFITAVSPDLMKEEVGSTLQSAFDSVKQL